MGITLYNPFNGDSVYLDGEVFNASLSVCPIEKNKIKVTKTVVDVSAVNVMSIVRTEYVKQGYSEYFMHRTSDGNSFLFHVDLLKVFI